MQKISTVSRRGTSISKGQLSIHAGLSRPGHSRGRSIVSPALNPAAPPASIATMEIGRPEEEPESRIERAALRNLLRPNQGDSAERRLCSAESELNINPLQSTTG